MSGKPLEKVSPEIKRNSLYAQLKARECRDIPPRAMLGSSPSRREDLQPSQGEVHFLYIAEHMDRYARLFRWEYRDPDTVEDRAALIGAIGWCSGWQPWLSLIG